MKLGKISHFFFACNIVAVSTLAIQHPAHADSIRDRQWYLRYLNIAEANRLSTGKGIVVAVVDSGVYPHPDLRGNILKGASFIAGDKGDGQQDPRGHGTGMAGIIAGHGHDGSKGTLGIAPDAKILPVRILDATGRSTGKSVTAGIEFATQEGVKILNASFGSAPSNDFSKALKAALDSDVLIVAAAGNRNQSLPTLPASFPGVLSVGASTEAGDPADFSATNSNVQICAPGSGIVEPDAPSGYSKADGTSEATAIVSGAAALIRAKFPDLSAKEVIHRITATATDIGDRPKCGAGIINIVKALTADVPPLDASVTASPSVGPAPGSSPVPGESSASAAGAPEDKPRAVNVPAVVGGFLGLVLVGGLVAFLVRRRRTAV